MEKGIPFGEFRLQRRIGQGGMAEVFLATKAGPSGFKKRIVIKRLLPHLTHSERFTERFLREARLAALIDHPNLVHVWGCGEVEGRYYLAMEFVDGVTLSELLRAVRTIAIPIACHLAIELLDALSAVHTAVDLAGAPLNLVHRDVTPRNVMLTRTGTVKLLDFGIATSVADAKTVIGTLRYMSPEQAQGTPLDARTDLYAVGVLLYRCITGRVPFEVAQEGTLERPGAVPDRLWALIKSALEIDPELRPATARDMQSALEAYLRESDDDFSRGSMRALVEGLKPSAPTQLYARVTRFTQSLIGRGGSVTESQPELEVIAPAVTEEPPITDAVILETPPDSEPAVDVVAKRPGLFALGWRWGLVPAVLVAVVLSDIGPRPAAVAPAIEEAAPSLSAPPDLGPKAEDPADADDANEDEAIVEVKDEAEPSFPKAAHVHAKRAPHGAGRTGSGPRPTRAGGLAPPITREDRTARGFGYVSIDARPWCHVFVDGTPIGTTPMEKRLVASGAHRLKLTNPDYGIMAEYDVVVHPGQVLAVNRSFNPRNIPRDGERVR
jgi:serine/threonine-protein kinase